MNTRTWIVLLLALPAAWAPAAWAQQPPDLSGVWSPAGGGRGGRGGAPQPMLLKPEYKQAYDAKRAKEREAAAKGEQLAVAGLCEPYGMPGMMQVAVYPTEIIQRPEQITIIGEAFSEVRRIYIGKKQLSLDDVDPGYYGHSVGHWDGDTLVVDTIGIKESVRGYQEMPHSAQMRIGERIRKTSATTLQDQITIDDPVVLEKAYTYTLNYKFVPNYEMVEFVCENNREYVDQNGVVRMRLHDK